MGVRVPQRPFLCSSNLIRERPPLALPRVTPGGSRESKYGEEINMRKTALASVGLLALLLLVFPARSLAQISVGISVRVGPPALPVYEQPFCPEPGYIWIPGYWAYSDDGYYWVPGTWVLPPEPGLLWTPGYWGWMPTVTLRMARRLLGASSGLLWRHQLWIWLFWSGLRRRTLGSR